MTSPRRRRPAIQSSISAWRRSLGGGEALIEVGADPQILADVSRRCFSSMPDRASAASNASAMGNRARTRSISRSIASAVGSGGA